MNSFFRFLDIRQYCAESLIWPSYHIIVSSVRTCIFRSRISAMPSYLDKKTLVTYLGLSGTVTLY